MIKQVFIALTLASLSVLNLVQAEQKVEFNGYELHYIVFNTTDLSPDIAKQYDIKRSGKRAFINLSVLKQAEDTLPFAVAADVSVTQRNLMGQRGDIELRLIKEGESMYHIGDFLIFDRETIWLDVTVAIEGEAPFEYSFSQQVWRD
jgi:hypothetical protein